MPAILKGRIMSSDEKTQALQRESAEEHRRAPGTFVAFFVLAGLGAALIYGTLSYFGCV